MDKDVKQILLGAFLSMFIIMACLIAFMVPDATKALAEWAVKEKPSKIHPVDDRYKNAIDKACLNHGQYCKHLASSN